MAYDVQSLQQVISLKKTIPFIFIGILFFFLLFFPQISLEASKTGLLLWFDTILPTLLPFLVLSQLILKTSYIHYFQKFLGPVFKKVFHCSEAGAFCAICGFLCGYPVGARLISLQMQDGILNQEEGQYLLSFCNNISPMFCISFGILHAIGSENILIYLLIIYGSALLFGFLTRPTEKQRATYETKKQTSSAKNIFQLIDVCIIDSFLILIKLCGYLILFSIISHGILYFLPKQKIYLNAFITAFLEITNGLSHIAKLPNGILRSAYGVAALSFGGLCCILQTSSVISDTNLSLRKYILHKTITTGIALILFFCFYFWSSFFSINGWS